MVIPPIGIVVQNHNCGTPPARLFLQHVEEVHDEILLIQRVGVAGVAILVGRGLNKADRWQVAVLYCIVEPGDVVTVVGRTIVSYL